MVNIVRRSYVASPRGSSSVPTSVSNILAFNSVVPSETLKINVSFHSGVVPCPDKNKIHLFLNLETQMIFD